MRRLSERGRSSLIEAATINTAVALRARTNSPINGSESSSKDVTVRLVDAQQILSYKEPWTDLARRALAPNVFYEPWMLLPAIEYLGDSRTLRFLLVFSPGLEELWGIFPLEIQSHCLRVPIRTLSFWQHLYCYLTVPLIDREHARKVLGAFWCWFERNPLGCHILDTNYLLADGPFHTLWTELSMGRSSLILKEHTRGLQVPSGTLESYLMRLVSREQQRTLHRRMRRLSELGVVSYSCVNRISDVELWVNEFLRLEASGWKGAFKGTALALRTNDANFFRALTRDGFRQGHAWLMSLSVGGRVIALKHELVSDGVGFGFKITYDEHYGKYSPGMLLELEHLRWLFRDGKIKWVDTCAAPQHPLFDLFSGERRIIRRALVSDGSRAGDFWLATLPLLRWIGKLSKRKDRPVSAAMWRQMERESLESSQLSAT